MFLVVVRALVEATAGAQAAQVTGLSAADLRHRLQGALPRVLMSDADGDRLAAISDRLDELGYITLVCDPRLAPTDADRLLAKSFRLEPDQLVVARRRRRRARGALDRDRGDPARHAHAYAQDRGEDRHSPSSTPGARC